MTNDYAIQVTQDFLNNVSNYLDPKVVEAIQKTINLAQYATRLATNLKGIKDKEDE